MECRQLVRSASRGTRTASSLLQPTRSSLILLQQQQRFQSSSPNPNPNRSAIDDLLANSPYKAAPTAPPASRTSTLFSGPRGAGLASVLPPRPQRPGQPNAAPLNPWAVGQKLIKQIEKDVGMMSGVNRTTTWNTEAFKKKYDLDKVEDLRTSPSVGRMVHVFGNVDARTAIARVNSLCSANKLKSMSISQKAHERPALRRKRKLREAWRVRFRTGFRAAVNRAMELRRQGW